MLVVVGTSSPIINVLLVPSVTFAIFTGRRYDWRKKMPRQRMSRWQSRSVLTGEVVGSL